MGQTSALRKADNLILKQSETMMFHANDGQSKWIQVPTIEIMDYVLIKSLNPMKINKIMSIMQYLLRKIIEN